VPAGAVVFQGAVGPALVVLPVTWAASDLAGAAGRWLRRTDGLSRIVRAATRGYLSRRWAVTPGIPSRRNIAVMRANLVRY
jgi:hypothetical protein